MKERIVANSRLRVAGVPQRAAAGRIGRMLITVAALLAAMPLTGCGAAATQRSRPAHPRERGVRGVRGIRAAALPYRILRGHGGSEIDHATFYRELGAARGVCVGEEHPNPHDHWAQLEVVNALSGSYRPRGARLALGMEMFQRPFQGVLDDYAAGRIDEAALLSRTGWAERWGYDFSLYRPIVKLAVKRGMALLALNANTELVKKVARVGIEGLSPADRARLPDLDLSDPVHRAWFNSVMTSMGGAAAHLRAGESKQDDRRAAKGSKPGDAGAGAVTAPTADAKLRADRIYAAQVLWDETMAASAAKWLSGGESRRIIILAGDGHCHETAIVKRLERRGVGNVVSVRPVIDDGQGNVARLLATPRNDYLFVMSAPRR